ncbi:hypothetical protein TSMEX_010800, partial [Taenia solium]
GVRKKGASVAHIVLDSRYPTYQSTQEQKMCNPAPSHKRLRLLCSKLKKYGCHGLAQSVIMRQQKFNKTHFSSCWHWVSILTSAVNHLNIVVFAFHALEAAAATQSPCLLNPCQNGGKCEVSKDAPGGYQCICLEPYGGHNCTIENPTCIDQPCLNGGACEDMPNQQFKCICPPGFAGGSLKSSSFYLYEVESLRCEFEDPCLVKPCKNGARCFSNNLGKRECQCPVGFTGEDCSVDVNECEVGERSPCEQNGTCINEPGGYRCECLNGYTGARCETLVLNCKPNPCLNGGVCDDKGDHFECLCPRASLRVLSPICLNALLQRVQVITFEDKDHSILDVIILVGGAAGFEGKVCEREINDCKGSPCQNGGVCEDLVDDFRCNCPPGWKGTFCEQPMLPCDSSPCLNNGVCENTPSGYVCHCPPGCSNFRSTVLC